MQFGRLDPYTIIDIFLLLLIGVGPKIALVPYLDATAGASETVKNQIQKKMLSTAAVVALLLAIFGGLLTKLLHFSPGALSIAGGIILLIIAVVMVLGSPSDPAAAGTSKPLLEQAVFPLAIPYLLNPAGIVVLVTVSAEAGSIGVLLAVLILLAIVLAIDVLVFRWANKVSEHLDESRMLVTEKVFGFLLAALAVQLVLAGLSLVGVIHLATH